MNVHEIQNRLHLLGDWQLNSTKDGILRKFTFTDFHRTMDFVNAVAKIANKLNHHPEMEIGYKHCLVKYTTHETGRLSEKDFICASEINTLSNNF